VNGWSGESAQTKKNILEHFNADIISICESHLALHDKTNFDNYVCFEHNIQLRNTRLKRTFGGVQVLIHNRLINTHDVAVIDKDRDGILCMRFTCKTSEFKFVLFSCYLPPQNSIWGRDADGFYAHILNLMYVHNDADMILIVGDLNSRIGQDLDMINCLDTTELPMRNALDLTKNRHGESLLDFLKDGQLCILNGRLSPEFNNFTFVQPSRGSSVVDYVITPHDNYHFMSSLKIHTPLQVMNLTNTRGQCPTDHSLLEFTFRPHHSLHGPDTNANACVAERPVVNNITPGIDSNRYYTRFNVKDVTENFLHSANAQTAIQNCITHIESVLAIQQEIDDIYTMFCNVYYNEMESTLRKKNVHPNSKKRLRHSLKPYWTERLSQLWRELCDSEKRYLSEPQHTRVRRQLRDKFIKSQKCFDKEYKREKRNYQFEKINEIESLDTSNPKKFWQEIKRLGPRSAGNIPMSVYQDGCLTSDPKCVLDTWKADFENLYNATPCLGTFDENFAQGTSHTGV
jgi:hypothetical protein